MQWHRTLMVPPPLLPPQPKVKVNYRLDALLFCASPCAGRRDCPRRTWPSALTPRAGTSGHWRSVRRSVAAWLLFVGRGRRMASGISQSHSLKKSKCLKCVLTGSVNFPLPPPINRVQWAESAQSHRSSFPLCNRVTSRLLFTYFMHLIV